MSKQTAMLNTTDIQNQELKLYDRIDHVNQELIRAKKIKAELERSLQARNENQQKKEGYINQIAEQHNKAAEKAEKIMKSRVEVPVTYGGSDEDWKKLKK